MAMHARSIASEQQAPPGAYSHRGFYQRVYHMMAQWYGLSSVQSTCRSYRSSKHGMMAKSPFLAAAATVRTGEDKIPGYYSAELDMWVVDTPDGVRPIIAEGALSELFTKTKVNVEQDDEACWQLEVMTKTFTKVESDDEHPQEQNHLLQLMTKTDANVERDDRSDVNHLLELITKTSVELERDDNGDPTFELDTRYYEG